MNERMPEPDYMTNGDADEPENEQDTPPWFILTYEHCGEIWHDEWDSKMYGRCPVCGDEIEAVDYEEMPDVE